MGLGLNNALLEITLVLFTTLAPSGVVACLAVGALLLSGRLPDGRRVALNKFLFIPILVALVGLVASATHLGNPGNALYVLAGIGRSPLSNEVFAGAVFFGLAGSYWFYSFSQVRRVVLERVWVVLFMMAGVLFLAGIAFAYDVDTIPTWNSPFVPANLVLNALVGGPLVALCAFVAAGVPVRGSLSRACLAVSGVSLAMNAAGYALQGAEAMGLANSLVTTAQLAPGYSVAVMLFAVLCATAIMADIVALRRSGNLPLPVAAAASVLALAGVFIMRFMFYMLHMTVGLGF